jgi:L-alanine-DL-glutamate epimerase-like enolase superfamily enzyme
MKSAGIAQALQINSISEAAGIGTMVGCMGEIQASIAAGLHFALSSENVRYADLDSHFSIIDDPSAGLTFEEGHLVTSGRPGLGVSVREFDL